MRINLVAILFALVSGMASAGPDLSGTLPILQEDFSENELNRYDGRSGLWSTLPRRGQLMTNAAETVFLDHGVLGPESDATLPPVHVITPEGLALRTIALSDDIKSDVASYMIDTGQKNRAQKIRFASGEITTAHTWAQTYGYFEIEARIPRGKGRWPAFWLTFAGVGWPPEIDVFEAYGAGLRSRTKKDHTFNNAVFFDALDADQQPVHEVEIENPYATNDEGRVPLKKKRGEREIYNFHQIQNPLDDFQADIYEDFYTYAALWTPETITFYFGKTRDNLVEIYKTPTPQDVNDQMFVIANDQFTARGGWWSADEKALEETLDPENAFVLRQITVRAFEPDLVLEMANGDIINDPRDSVIHDTAGDDLIAPGAGFDILSLSGGKDTLLLQRDRQNKIISGFGPDDTIVLEGYPFFDVADVLSRLTQVGSDVWLPSGADPAWPHTIIFRDATTEQFEASQFEVKWPLPRDIWLAEAKRSNRPETDLDKDGLLSARAPGAWLNDRRAAVAITGTSLTDRFIVSNLGTTINEQKNGGIDTLISWVDYTIPENIEHGIVRGKSTSLSASPKGHRLETYADRVFLTGNSGDDLFVIAPEASFITVNIAKTGGHDKLRGFGPGHRLALSATLRAAQEQWQLFDHPQGVLVDFGNNQTLLVEAVDKTSVRRVLGLQ